MAWCAGTSTRPRSDRLAAFSIAMTGTGSRASPRSWKARTVSSRSCIGRRSPDAAPPPLPRRRERRHRLRILLATDAWAPQVNGVVMTLRNTIRGLEAAGHVVETISPDRFRNIPCPTYPEIRLALHPFPRFADLAHRFEPDAVHIATEGPVGQAARKFCLREQLAFTTAYHTRFPEYVHARIRLPVRFTYDWLRRFHALAKAVMVATLAVHADLERRGFRNLVMWTRGVDTELFRPGPPLATGWTRPIFMYVGRV